MPYVKGSFCFPYEVKNINTNDIVVVKPASIKTRGKIVVIPPLSLVSENCNKPLDSIFWIDGVRIKGKENIHFLEGKIEVNSNIEVLSPEFLPGYTLQKILKGVRLKVAQNTDGVPILSADNYPLVLIKKGEVYINTTDYSTLFKLLGYSVYYYISSEYSDEI